VWVIVGFLLSLHGRVESEWRGGNQSTSGMLVARADDGPGFPWGNSFPPGQHKDQDGCYHSHAPFHTPATTFLVPISFSMYVTEAISLFLPTIPFNISYPPRA